MKQRKNKSYQDFVFDLEKGAFIGEFESMYANEKTLGYDSWDQDQDSYAKELDLALLRFITFKSFIDIGCGKGKFTNMVQQTYRAAAKAYDASPSAIKIAKSRYPNISFYVDSFSVTPNNLIADLIIFRASLYYIPNWKELLQASEKAEYILVGLNIPKKTLGTIKSFKEFDDFLLRKWIPISGYKGLDGTSRVCLYKKR